MLHLVTKEDRERLDPLISDLRPSSGDVVVVAHGPADSTMAVIEATTVNTFPKPDVLKAMQTAISKSGAKLGLAVMVATGLPAEHVSFMAVVDAADVLSECTGIPLIEIRMRGELGVGMKVGWIEFEGKV